MSQDILERLRAWVDRETLEADPASAIRQAIAEIETLRYTSAALSRLDEIARGFRDLPTTWVPVGERLPEIDGTVIVCVSGDHVTTMRRHSQDGFWQHADGDVDEIAVTHWMPLPKPPPTSGASA